MAFNSFFLKLISDHTEDNSNLNIVVVKRLNVYIIISLSVILLWTIALLSFYNKEFSISFTLLISSFALIIAGIILHKKNHLLLQIQYATMVICGILGLALLMHNGSYNPIYSLVWFIMFTSMLAFTLGLFHGTIFFITYFILLLALFFFPHDFSVSEKITQGARIRLLMAMLGTFLYSYSAEYLRYKTQLALTTLLLKSEKLANTDSLTGLRNRHNFENTLANIICVNESMRQPFALLLIDIDYFKNVNDTYGHEIGDQVLKHFAEVLTQQKRNGDFLFRWGGEEFILILQSITAEYSYSLANRIREYIEDTPFINDTLNISYTASIGIYCGQGKEGNNQIMKIADVNMYKAKKAGRNCVVI